MIENDIAYLVIMASAIVLTKISLMFLDKEI